MRSKTILDPIHFFLRSIKLCYPLNLSEVVLPLKFINHPVWSSMWLFSFWWFALLQKNVAGLHYEMDALLRLNHAQNTELVLLFESWTVLLFWASVISSYKLWLMILKIENRYLVHEICSGKRTGAHMHCVRI